MTPPAVTPNLNPAGPSPPHSMFLLSDLGPALLDCYPHLVLAEDPFRETLNSPFFCIAIYVFFKYFGFYASAVSKAGRPLGLGILIFPSRPDMGNSADPGVS